MQAGAEPKEADGAPAEYCIRCIAPDVSAITLRVRPGLTGGELRARVAAVLADAPPSRLRLICGGRLLGDSETLAAAGVAEGHVVHVAIRPADAPLAATPLPALEPEPGAEHDADLSALQLALQAELLLLAERSSEARGGGRGVRWERRGREGDASDFLFGLVTGLLLGVMGFLCVMEPAAPRALKAGIFLGVLLNVSGSLARAGGDPRAARDDVSDW